MTVADLADVQAELVSQIVSAVYPNGPTAQSAVGVATTVVQANAGSNSIQLASVSRLAAGLQITLWGGTKETATVAANPVAGTTTVQLATPLANQHAPGSTVTYLDGVKVYAGWPVTAALDADLALGITNVSVYPLPWWTSTPYQILDQTYVQKPVTYGLSVSVAGGAITVTGTPVSGEVLTVVADRAFIFSASGATAAAILSALLTQAKANYPTASLAASTLTIPYDYELDVRQGGIATLAKVTHRQCQMVAVTVWASDPTARANVATAVDTYIKQNVVVTLPDTSQAKIVYSRTSEIDDAQTVTVYRRDLVYECEYATLETFPGYQITSVSTSITDLNQAPANEPTVLVVN